jgi:SAM-dependent methyltransferase
MSDPQGLAYATLAEDYDLGRASWPPELLDGVDAEIVLDLAAGTGKLTALLAERFAKVVAVEPLPEMRAVLQRNVPAARAVEGTAERIPLDDACVDAVFVADAFHWFDSELAAREIERVLRPGGWLVVCFAEWRHGFQPGLGADAHELLEEVGSRLPPQGGVKIQTGRWREGLRAFEPLEERALDHDWVTDAEGVAAHYVSFSSMGSLPRDERIRLREQLVGLLPDVRHRLVLTTRVYSGRLPPE